jgi:hypothetical protein
VRGSRCQRRRADGRLRDVASRVLEFGNGASWRYATMPHPKRDRSGACVCTLHGHRCCRLGCGQPDLDCQCRIDHRLEQYIEGQRITAPLVVHQRGAPRLPPGLRTLWSTGALSAVEVREDGHVRDIYCEASQTQLTVSPRSAPVRYSSAIFIACRAGKAKRQRWALAEPAGPSRRGFYRCSGRGVADCPYYFARSGGKPG